MAVIRVEKTKDYTVMCNYHLRETTLSLKAKGLLSIMLSLPDHWNYSICGLASICKEGRESIGNTLRELENAGYMIRRQLRNEKGRITDTEYVIFEYPHTLDSDPETCGDTAGNDVPDAASPSPGNPDMDTPPVETQAQLNTYQSNTERSSKDQSVCPARSGDRWTEENAQRDFEEMERCREIVKENIDYEILLERLDPDWLYGIVEIIVAGICATRPYTIIKQNRIPTQAIKGRLLSLSAEHIEYVRDELGRAPLSVKNKSGYILSCLYDAPVSMAEGIRSQVNYDLYGKSTQECG